MFFRTGKEWTFELIHNDTVWKYHKCLARVRATDEFEFYDVRDRMIAKMWENRLGGWCKNKENKAGMPIRVIDDFVRKHPFFKQVFDEIPIQESRCSINYYKWGDVVKVFMKHCVKVTFQKLGEDEIREMRGIHPY